MKTHSANTTNNKSQAIANNLPQQQHTPDGGLTDESPDTIHVQDLKAIANDSPQVKQLRKVQAMANEYVTKNGRQNNSPANSGMPVQRKVAPVEIIWAVTHIVRKVGESIFGGDDYKENEVQELTQGQQLTIDDEKTFTSRRGQNQEDPKKRSTDQASTPSHVWYHVVKLNGKDVSGDTLYVREGTFGAASSAPQKAILSQSDEQLLNAIVKTANTSALGVQGDWNALIQNST